jgi:ABC-type glycerol-3-phosphate transport system permease component
MPADVLETPVEPEVEPEVAAHHKPHRKLRTIGSYILLTAGAVIVLFPIYVTIVNSLLPADQLVHQPPPLFPTNPSGTTTARPGTAGRCRSTC